MHRPSGVVALFFLVSLSLFADLAVPRTAAALPGRRPGEEQLEPVPGARLAGGVLAGGILNTESGGLRGIENPLLFGMYVSLGGQLTNGLYIGPSLKIWLGQKVDGDISTSQQFGLDVGYSRPMRVQYMIIRPILEVGFQRYHTDVMGIEANDYGFYAAFGGDLVADVREHFYLKTLGRIGFAMMGDGSGDISVSGGATDVFVVVGVTAGLRF